MGNFYGVTLQGGTERRWHDLRDHSGWRTDHAVQLLPAKRVCRWRLSASPLIQGTDGIFYGSTISGGATGYGVVFSLDVGLGPFVEHCRDG